MSNRFLQTLNLTDFLSFGPKTAEIDLCPLNVLIGPNGSGKSNFIEAVELLHAAPTDISSAIRLGGTPDDWIWKGRGGERYTAPLPVGNGIRAVPVRPQASLSARLRIPGVSSELRYSLRFSDARGRLEINDEVVEDAHPDRSDKESVSFYYRYNDGDPVINVRQSARGDKGEAKYERRHLGRGSITQEQSVLSQRKDPDLYPEITGVATQFDKIQLFREWSFGRGAPLRQAQPTALPNEELLPTLVNLGLVLNDLEHKDDWPRFIELMKRFFPRFSHVKTQILGPSVQIQLFEDNLKTPVPATRLSDGTLRFITLLAILLRAEKSPLLCIEEPELGLHPDAISILADLLVEASHKTQVVVTTHSDNLVSALSEHADSVLVCEYERTGTMLRRLESEKLREWLKRYSLGDLWLKGELGGVRW